MRPETEAAAQAPTTTETSAEPEAASPSATAAVATAEAAGRTVRIPPKPTRAPRKRAPKLDEVLTAAVDQARAALEGLAADEQIGQHVGAVADDDRLVTHRFAATLPGYGGWEWFVTVARAPRSKVVTVCETGLLPGAGAILAPDWVPWSERVSQEEKIRMEAIAAGQDPDEAVAHARGASDASSDDTADDQAKDSAKGSAEDEAEITAGVETQTEATDETRAEAEATDETQG